MFPELTLIVGFFIGAAIGSFLNVVIYRLPKGMSLSHPPSHCPNCEHRLGVMDLFPLLSYLLTGGKCRYCKNKVSPRYFWVEILTGTFWATFWFQYLVAGSDPVRFLVLSAFASILIAASFIDLRWYIIPESLNAALLVLGLGYNVYLISQNSPMAWFEFAGFNLPSSVAGAILGVAVYWFIAFFGLALFKKDALGHGDILLARGIGAVLFPVAAGISFGLSVVVGAVFGILQIAIRPKNQPEEDLGAEDEDYEPESIGGLAKCGLGYLFCFDIISLFSPKFDKAWFGEEPQTSEEPEEEWVPGQTQIPFGPYLALGALLSAIFQPQLVGLFEQYWNWAMGGR